MVGHFPRKTLKSGRSLNEEKEYLIPEPLSQQSGFEIRSGFASNLREALRIWGGFHDW